MDQAQMDKVDRYYEATKEGIEELAEWIGREEERLQRELTDEEIGNKHKELKVRYNIREEDFL